MVIYKNDYTKEEDGVLWELHEVRHQLSEEYKHKSIEDINKEALIKFNSFKLAYKR